MISLNSLEKKFGWLAVPNLTMLIITGQLAVFAAAVSSQPELLSQLDLNPVLVAEGEIWRLLTFIFIPPGFHPIWVFFAWYIFYLMGAALEGYWGDFRYTLYLLIAYAATLAAVFGLFAYYRQLGVAPHNLHMLTSNNTFLAGTVFLAFAHLNPEFVLLLFFVLPVKIRWLAALTWVMYGWAALTGDWTTRTLIIASVLNYLLFFGRDIYITARRGHWRMEHSFREFAEKNKPIHTCTVCGVTDKSDRQMEFRYCTKCEGKACFCMNHIRDHKHAVKTGAKK